ncbi:urate hydroxylase PuuD [Sphingorhabdus sp. Alg239-R122]|uniref:urate hydroxylase PuuD n=1 Tax=Sphingorhabdus sp. Alg239-R122 TaxID=2305989 RepID=UPI0013D8FDFC|nr:urate hydroxylase PuuD [Sphingorhabdus sp. Alg239-R122]
MAKILGNLNTTLLIGLVLAIALIFYAHGDATTANQIFRWFHAFIGILWIGLLYYFNFVQIPAMAAIPAEQKPAISKHIAPSALFYFRWAAAFTVLTGLIVAHLGGFLHQALMLQEGYRLIGIGMWLAIIMAANVWFIIWPNQKKALGIVEASDEQKANAGKIAMMASRTNTLLSLPMLYSMVNANMG